MRLPLVLAGVLCLGATAPPRDSRDSSSPPPIRPLIDDGVRFPEESAPHSPSLNVQPIPPVDSLPSEHPLPHAVNEDNDDDEPSVPEKPLQTTFPRAYPNAETHPDAREPLHSEAEPLPQQDQQLSDDGSVPSEDEKPEEVEKIFRGLRIVQNAILGKAIQEASTTPAKPDFGDEDSEPSTLSPEEVKARFRELLKKLAEQAKNQQEEATGQGDEEEQGPVVDHEDGGRVGNGEKEEEGPVVIVQPEEGEGRKEVEERKNKALKWLQSLPQLEEGADEREAVDPEFLSLLFYAIYDSMQKLHRIQMDTAALEEGAGSLFHKLFYVFKVNRLMSPLDFVKRIEAKYALRNQSFESLQ